jgi:hypothetical protein
MNLKNLAKKPELIKLVIDDEATVTEYGEPIEFYTYDRQPISTFLKVATGDRTDPEVLLELMKNLILDETGATIISEENILPSKVLMTAFTKLVDVLGK